jgi:hypothetical protein
MVILVLSLLSRGTQAVEGEGAPRVSRVRVTKDTPDRRVSKEKSIVADSLPTLVVSTDGRVREYIEAGNVGSVAGVDECGEVTYTDPGNFTGGVYNIQQGFVGGEYAIASYTLSPDDFPLKLLSAECAFGQDAVVDTTTVWELIVFDGPPLPEYVHSIYRSDDIILPHLTMPPGRHGTNIRVVVDPEDPSQIILTDPGGYNTFSVGFGVVEHNAPLLSPCVLPDPQELFTEYNAFPMTDADDVFSLTGNWLSALTTCGTLCDGLNRFENLFPLLCRPSGDWIIRATFECSIAGACCDVDGFCTDNVNGNDCTNAGGTFMGQGSMCGALNCPTPVGACCLSGECLDDVAESVCESLTDAFYMGNGSPCDGALCALGACCMEDGSCEDFMPIECSLAAGTYEGAETSCATFDCPQPRGSCCIETTCVENQARDTCEALGTWNGSGSTCDPDPCGPDCPVAAILEATPADGTVDARQPHDPASALIRQGIGSVSEPIVVTLDVTGAEACFSLCESAPDPVLGANDIASVTYVGSGRYEIVLEHAIAPGAHTTIYYAGTGDSVRYVSHPANVDGDGAANEADISRLLEALGGAPPAFGLHSVDMDHSGTLTGADLLRLVDLLNGGDALEAWNGTSFPQAGSCP